MAIGGVGRVAAVPEHLQADPAGVGVDRGDRAAVPDRGGLLGRRRLPGADGGGRAAGAGRDGGQGRGGGAEGQDRDGGGAVVRVRRMGVLPSGGDRTQPAPPGRRVVEAPRSGVSRAARPHARRTARRRRRRCGPAPRGAGRRAAGTAAGRRRASPARCWTHDLVEQPGLGELGGEVAPADHPDVPAAGGRDHRRVHRRDVAGDEARRRRPRSARSSRWVKHPGTACS